MALISLHPTQMRNQDYGVGEEVCPLPSGAGAQEEPTTWRKAEAGADGSGSGQVPKDSTFKPVTSLPAHPWLPRHFTPPSCPSLAVVPLSPAHVPPGAARTGGRRWQGRKAQMWARAWSYTGLLDTKP